MDFEDTKLTDTPKTRLAFRQAEIDTNMRSAFTPSFQDDGLSPGSLTLMVRAAQILQDTVPHATDGQIATAMLFLSGGFGQPVLMQRALGNDLPEAAAWSKEWRDVQRGATPLSQASIELRQIVLAADTAVLEGIQNNLGSVNTAKLPIALAQHDIIAADVGDIQAPKMMQLRSTAQQDIVSRTKNSSAPKPPGA